MIMPVACGQLLHAFVFDRDCFPKVRFIEYSKYLADNARHTVIS